MNFKKMELYGFKSFADKVQVNFESGVTGIVGPNGCGKSNVADAIKWVLGEQSAKALRGSSMQDVIFNGTESRKSQSFCEVSLYFDNSSKIFKVEYDEVVISRKLYRSGDSEYLINKQPVRLKDVYEILRDSGLGKESYSIIGQGRIDELLSAKPEDRRMVFEEAAGISNLKFRKNETEKKLEKTKDNLVRLIDILHELEIQLGPLKEQADVAKKYLELKERLKDLEINIYLSQYDSSTGKKSEISNRIAGLSEEINVKTNEFEACVNNYNNTFNEMRNIDDTIEKLRDELLDLTVGLEKQAGESRLLQEKLNNSFEQNKKLDEDVKNLSLQYDNNKNKLIELTENKKVKTIVLSELSAKLENALQQENHVNQKILFEENSIDERNAKLIDDLGQLSDVKSKVSALSSENNMLITKLNELTTKKTDILQKAKAFKDEVEKSTKRLSNAKKEKQKLIDEERKEKQNQVKLSYKKNGIEDDIQSCNVKVHELTSRLSLMQEMQKENEGYIASVRKILENSKTNTTLAGKFVGVVAKLMKVPEKFETAIEMALGVSVQNIVTKNENDAKYVIEFLKEKNLGRATFMPMTSMKERKIPREFEKIISSTKNVYGVAVDLISFDKKYYSVFSSMLGSTVITENIDTAILLAKNTGYSFKIVTLDGDVINPQGTIAGGSKKNQAVSIIGREREIQSVAEQIENTKQEIEQKKKLLISSEKEVSDSEAKIYELARLQYDMELQIVKENENLSKINQLSQEVIKNASDVEMDEKNAIKRKNEIDKEIKVFGEIEKKLNKGENVSELQNALNPKLRELKIDRENLLKEITEFRIKKTTEENLLVNIDAELLRITDENETVEKSLRRLKLELQQTLTDISESQGKYTNVVDKTKYEENMKKLQTVRDKLSAMDSRKDDLSINLGKIDEQKMLLSAELQKARDKKSKEEASLIKIDADIETMQERVFEEYGLTYSSAIEYRTDNFKLEAGISECGKIKKQINTLGVVNVNAIEMLETTGGRYNELSIQRDDLVAGEEDLTKILNGLVTEMQSKFKVEFEKIDKNFQQVFKELFGGGRANLTLSEPENCLECGIDISAEPPGKKLQSIGLMSGGERALTAIAILFAILKLRPMPFCVLDEIEAALDDANAERFAKYLKRFSNYTQFIVITHRKPTMELADSLYGVTMQERGVSKIVSVQLSEALKNSEKGK